MSGYFLRMLVAQSRMVCASGRRRVLLNSKVTPLRLMTLSNGQPSPSTREPAAVSGHLSALSTTPSPSVSVKPVGTRSEEHTSELQSLMRISYAVFCLKKKKNKQKEKRNEHVERNRTK